MKKEITIIVNGKQKTVEKEEASFRDVVLLAFPDATFEPLIEYTVNFKRGHGNKPEGELLEGDELKFKDGMIINVGRTDRS